MIAPDMGALHASRISLQGCGCLHGPYYQIQQRDLAGPSLSDVGSTALDAGSAYLKSGNVKDLYGPAFKLLQGFSAALPPPFNLLATFAEEKAKDAIDAIQDYYVYAAECAAQFLPASVAPQFIKWFGDNAGTLWADAAKDRIAYWLRDFPTVAQWLSAKTPLNLTVQTRLADLFYKKAKEFGANDVDAAFVAYKLVCDQPGNASVDDPKAAKLYASKVSPSANPTDIFGVYQAWQKSVASRGGKQVDSKDYKKTGAETPTEGSAAPLLAVGLLAALLLAR